MSSIEFKSPEHEKVYHQLAGILRDLFGKSAVADSRGVPQFWLTSGSAELSIGVSPAGDNDASIWLQAWINIGAEPSLAFYEFLLKANGNLRFGGFFLDDSGNVGYDYQFPASGLTERTVEWTVRAIISTADEYDDQIVQRFGGRRPSDRKQP